MIKPCEQKQMTVMTPHHYTVFSHSDYDLWNTQLPSWLTGPKIVKKYSFRILKQTMHHLHDFYLSHCYCWSPVRITLNCTNIPCIFSFCTDIFPLLGIYRTRSKCCFFLFCFKPILCQINLGITASASVILLAESWDDVERKQNNTDI